jgi:predicted metal-dependent hydrolase
VIPERAAHYAALMGVTYGRITIRAQKTRWGSCSSKGNLSFNCLLMLAPPEVLDSVVVHELCHLRVMNHSERFYAEVLRVFPEYREKHGWLKDNGDMLLAMLDD